MSSDPIGSIVMYVILVFFWPHLGKGRTEVLVVLYTMFCVGKLKQIILCISVCSRHMSIWCSLNDQPFKEHHARKEATYHMTHVHIPPVGGMCTWCPSSGRNVQCGLSPIYMYVHYLVVHCIQVVSLYMVQFPDL